MKYHIDSLNKWMRMKKNPQKKTNRWEINEKSWGMPFHHCCIGFCWRKWFNSLLPSTCSNSFFLFLFFHLLKNLQRVHVPYDIAKQSVDCNKIGWLSVGGWYLCKLPDQCMLQCAFDQISLVWNSMCGWVKKTENKMHAHWTTSRL